MQQPSRFTKWFGPLAEIEIRRADPSEYDAIAKLTVTAYDVLEEDHSAAHQEYLVMLADVAGRAAQADVIVAVGTDGTVLGSTTLVLDTDSEMAEWDEDGTAGFRMLAVAMHAQGKGVGRKLTEHCIDAARAANKTAVLIHSRDIMQAARHIYSGYGFVRHPEIDFEVEGIKLDGFRLAL